jgi:hypothetical protein
MAETSWSKVSEQGAAGVVIREIGPRIDRAVTAADPVLHHSLHDVAPGVLPPAAEPPRQPQPSETELRAKLGQAVEAYRAARHAEIQAENVMQRESRHLAACTQAVDRFVGLDDQIAAATIPGLRDTASSPNAELQALRA